MKQAEENRVLQKTNVQLELNQFMLKLNRYFLKNPVIVSFNLSKSPGSSSAFVLKFWELVLDVVLSVKKTVQ